MHQIGLTEHEHLLKEFTMIPSRGSCSNWRACAMVREITPILDTL